MAPQFVALENDRRPEFSSIDNKYNVVANEKEQQQHNCDRKHETETNGLLFELFPFDKFMVQLV